MLKTSVAELLLKKYGKKNPPVVKSGDTVRVHQKIKEGDKERIQIFEGLVIAVKHGNGLDGTFTVRKIAVGGIGVERTYPLHSPMIVKVERTKQAEVSRAKLYYMRDRKGKTARFKHESAAPMAWDESTVVATAVTEDVAEENVIAEEAVEQIIQHHEEIAEAAQAEEATPAEQPLVASSDVETPVAEESETKEA